MSNTPNLPAISMNSFDLASVSPENINKLFEEIFAIDVSIPDWASARAEGNFFPSAQLCTRDGRLTGNAVLMWWTIVNGMPAAVVSTDAGNTVIATQSELEGMFYSPEFLMREPLYAHLSGVVAAGIEIPDEFRFLFEIGGVPLDEDEDIDDFETYTDTADSIFLVMINDITDPEVVEEQVCVPYQGLDFGDDTSFSFSITDSNGCTLSASFKTAEELGKYLSQMGIAFQS